MLYLCGGNLDPNLIHFKDFLDAKGRSYQFIAVGRGQEPAVHWDFQKDTLHVDGVQVEAPTSVLLRYDVFSNLEDGRPQSAFRAHCWYAFWEGWLLSHPATRMLNRYYSGTSNKAAVLHLAREIGFSIPPTVLSNDISQLQPHALGWSSSIVKPVVGGEYTDRLLDVLKRTEVRSGKAAAPAFVQRELIPPEVRVYRIGSSMTAFQISSSHLDYRTDGKAAIQILADLDVAVQDRLWTLTNALGLDYAAADLKFNQESGTLDFLEVNSAPMFSAFDSASHGLICQQILDLLDGR